MARRRKSDGAAVAALVTVFLGIFIVLAKLIVLCVKVLAPVARSIHAKNKLVLPSVCLAGLTVCGIGMAVEQREVRRLEAEKQELNLQHLKALELQASSLAQQQDWEAANRIIDQMIKIRPAYSGIAPLNAIVGPSLKRQRNDKRLAEVAVGIADARRINKSNRLCYDEQFVQDAMVRLGHANPADDNYEYASQLLRRMNECQEAIRQREKQAVEREASRQAAREAAEARRLAARPVVCRDGTVSSTCTCGGSRRGCCSRHGGVSGCTN